MIRLATGHKEIPLLGLDVSPDHRLAVRLRNELKVEKRLPSVLHLCLLKLERAARTRGAAGR